MSIAASVLDCFAAHRELGATQVARELGVAKSTACRMLSALAAGGLLDRADGGRYRLSLRMFELGMLAAERMPVRDAARPVLRAARAAGWVSTREEFTRGFSSVAGPTGRILGLRRDFIVASVCRAARRVGTLVTPASED